MKQIQPDQAKLIDQAIRFAQEGRECEPPLNLPLTAKGESLDSGFHQHCAMLTGRSRPKAPPKPCPVSFASRLDEAQRAYVLAIPVLRLTRWGAKVRAAVKAINS